MIPEGFESLDRLARIELTETASDISEEVPFRGLVQESQEMGDDTFIADVAQGSDDVTFVVKGFVAVQTRQ